MLMKTSLFSNDFVYGHLVGPNYWVLGSRLGSSWTHQSHECRNSWSGDEVSRIAAGCSTLYHMMADV
jgi:hypothetical protein